jgi:UDP-N-acetyl-D-mannosaminuronic acid dehydrogenase
MVSRNKTTESEVVVIGLGYVGLTLAAHLARSGFKVHGVEVREFILAELAKGKAFFLEEGLDPLLKTVIENGSFSFYNQIPFSDRSRIFVITVGTPLNSDGSANMDFIKRVSEEVRINLRENDFVILRSTVKIGTTRDVVKPILDNANVNYGLAFCPERTLEGAALREIAQLPQIIGALNSEDLDSASNFFTKITNSVIQVSSLETAELIKLVDNMQRDVHFAISNEVARICNNLEVSAHEVISSGKLGYPRTNLASPGPVGGPCLEKDSYLLNESMSWDRSLSLSAREVNESIVEESLCFLEEILGARIGLSSERKLRVGILGLAFKGVPPTNDLRGSLGVAIVNSLMKRFPNILLSVFDPVVKNEDLGDLDLDMSHEIESVFVDADLVIITNNHPDFAALDLDSLSNGMSHGAVIYDLWGRYKTEISGNGNLVASWGGHGIARQILK